MNKKISITSCAMTISVIVIVMPALIYPFLFNSIAWLISECVCFMVMVFLTLCRRRFPKDILLALWCLTLFPLLFNSYALQVKEIGFTIIWITFLLILLNVPYNVAWINNVLRYIGICTFIYALITVILNIGITEEIGLFALWFRGKVQQGTLQTAGLTAHYTHNSIYISIAIIVCFSYVLRTKKKTHILVTILSLLALFFTKKRGPLIAVFFSMLTIFYITLKGSLSKKIQKQIIGIVVSLITISIVYACDPRVFAVFERFSIKNNILSNRQYLWMFAGECFNRHPIFGCGWGYFSHFINFSVDNVSVTQINAHNIYLQLLAETGIIGFICFLTPMIATLICSVRTLKKIKNINCSYLLIPMHYSLCYQVFFFVHGITDNAIYDRITLIPYMLAIIIYMNCRNRLKENAITNKDRNDEYVKLKKESAI